MTTVHIYEIEFSEKQDSFKSENYPHSGLFIVKDNLNKTTDIRFVNNSFSFVLCIAPDDVFIRECNVQTVEALTDTETKTELKTNFNSEIDQNFILEFTKILLNRK